MSDKLFADLFTIDRLRALCKGDVTRLPRLVVHPNHKWPGPAKVDNKNRIHMDARTFEAVVLPQVPVGLEAEIDGVQIYRMALEPHHLEGGELVQGTRPHDQKAVRRIVGADPDTAKPADAD